MRNIRKTVPFIVGFAAMVLMVYSVVFCFQLVNISQKSSPCNEIVKQVVNDEKSCSLLLNWAERIWKDNSNKAFESWSSTILNQSKTSDRSRGIPSGYTVNSEVGVLEKSKITYTSMSASVVLPPEIEKLVENVEAPVRISISFGKNQIVKVSLNRSAIFIRISENGSLPNYIDGPIIGGPSVFGLLSKR